METPIPENVTIHKDEKPKGWSYPLKTSEILAGLRPELPITVSYSNSLPWINQKLHRRFKSFPILSLTYYGKRHKNAAHDSDRIYMVVNVVPSKHRKFLNQIIVESVLSVVQKWIETVSTDPMMERDMTQLVMGYGSEFNITGQDYDFGHYLTLTERRKNVLWSKKVELDDKEKGDE